MARKPEELSPAGDELLAQLHKKVDHLEQRQADVEDTMTTLLARVGTLMAPGAAPTAVATEETL